MGKVKRVMWMIAGGVVLGLAVGQVIPVSRDNPPIESDIGAPPEVAQVLRASCYDCHSHETRWPWYAQVVPSSWFVSHHVNEGREHLNFSRWPHGTPEAAKKLDEIAEEVGEGEMPLGSYGLLHSEAMLDDARRKVLLDWVQSQRAK